MSSKTKEQHDLDSEIYQLVWAVSKGEKHPHEVFQRIVEILDEARAKGSMPHEKQLEKQLDWLAMQQAQLNKDIAERLDHLVKELGANKAGER